MNQASIAHEQWYLGIDVGGTKVATQLLDDHGVTHAMLSLPFVRGDHDQSIGSILAAINATLASIEQPVQLAAIGVGVPGQVDPASGVVRHAVNLGWHDVALRDEIQRAMNTLCIVENDVRAAALGVHRFWYKQQVHAMAYLNVGTGVAAGIVLDDQVFRGVRGIAGEIGHAPIEADGPRCGCGAYGCLETFIAGPAIIRQAHDAIAAGQPSTLATLDPTQLRASAVYHAARDGDAVAQQIVTAVAERLGRAIKHLVMSYDVERIAIGGGVASTSPNFATLLESALATQRTQSAFAAMVLPATLVDVLPADFQAGTWGALALALAASEPRP